MVAYDDPLGGETYLLVIKNALHVPSMEINLIPPFMMRLAGIEVNECPKFLSEHPTIKNHSIFFREEKIRIPLQLSNTVSYLPTRVPATDEMDVMDTPDIKTLYLTPNSPSWNPHNDSFQSQEYNMTDHNGNIITSSNPTYLISDVVSNIEEPNLFSNELIMRCKESNIPDVPNFSVSSVSCVMEDGIYQSQGHPQEGRGESISVVNSSGAKSDLSPRRLAKVLDTSVEDAIKTMKITERFLPRNTKDITLDRRHDQDDMILRYKRMKWPLYSDTAFASGSRSKKKNSKRRKVGTSVRGHTCFQTSVTEYGWVHFGPMNQRNEAHQVFKKIFKTYGVPPKIYMDPAKEQVSGETKKLCDKLGCEIIGTESGIKCKRAEATVRRFKHRICRRMEEANSPAVFWCYCGEREAMVMNSTVQTSPVFKFLCENQVPELVMTGTPTDISAISAFEWWELVKFKQEGKVFPFQHSHIGRCLGPAPNFGTELCYNVLTTTGKVIPVSTLRSLTPTEKSSPRMIEKIKKFDDFIYERFGDPRNSPDESLEHKNVKGESNEEEMPNEHIIDSLPEEYNWQTYLESTNDFKSDIPEVSDHKNEEEFETYLNAEVLLPQNGAHMRSAKVIGRAKDFDGMDIGSYNPNPLLDTRVYEVMFPDGAIEQYASNVIADNILN